MNIVTLLMVNGEEIIGRLKQEDASTITIEKPVRIALSPKGVGFAPLCVSIDDASEFTFKLDHVLVKASTRKEITDPYVQATTGLQLATSL